MCFPFQWVVNTTHSFTLDAVAPFLLITTLVAEFGSTSTQEIISSMCAEKKMELHLQQKKKRIYTHIKDFLLNHGNISGEENQMLKTHNGFDIDD